MTIPFVTQNHLKCLVGSYKNVSLNMSHRHGQTESLLALFWLNHLPCALQRALSNTVRPDDDICRRRFFAISCHHCSNLKVVRFRPYLLCRNRYRVRGPSIVCAATMAAAGNWWGSGPTDPFPVCCWWWSCWMCGTLYSRAVMTRGCKRLALAFNH